jgi:hypothetical protein
MAIGRYHHTALKLLQSVPAPFAGRTDIPCKAPGADPDLWFEPTTETSAIAACRPCPVREQCAAWATRTRQPYGVWGGTTRADRIPPGVRRGARSLV